MDDAGGGWELKMEGGGWWWMVSRDGGWREEGEREVVVLCVVMDSAVDEG